MLSQIDSDTELTTTAANDVRLINKVAFHCLSDHAKSVVVLSDT